MQLGPTHVTDKRPVLSYHQNPLPFVVVVFCFPQTPCSWLRIIWKLTTVSSILAGLVLSHESPGLCASHWEYKSKGERDGLCPQRAPERWCPHAQNPRGQFSAELRGPPEWTVLPASCPAAQGSCLLSDTVSTSSPSRAYEMQPPRAGSFPAFYTGSFRSPNARGQVPPGGTIPTR